MDEKNLIKQIKQGDSSAFEILLTPYRNYLLKVIYGFTRDAQDSEEVLQEVSLKIFQSVNSFSGNHFKSWITRITINYCIDQKRKIRLNTISLEALAENSQMDEYQLKDPAVTPHDHVLNKESDESIFRLLDSLPEEYRKTLKLYYFSELTSNEIADKLEISPRTVESRIYRARKILEERLRRNAL